MDQSIGLRFGKTKEITMKHLKEQAKTIIKTLVLLHADIIEVPDDAWDEIFQNIEEAFASHTGDKPCRFDIKNPKGLAYSVYFDSNMFE